MKHAIGLVFSLMLLSLGQLAYAQTPGPIDQSLSEAESEAFFPYEWGREPIPGQLIMLVKPTVTDQEAKDLFLSLGHLILEVHLFSESGVAPVQQSRDSAIRFPVRSQREYEAPWYRIYTGLDAAAAAEHLLLSEKVAAVKYIYREGWQEATVAAK